MKLIKRLKKQTAITCLIAMVTMLGSCDSAPGDGWEAFIEPFQPPSPLEAATWANNQFDPDIRRKGLAWTSTAYYADEDIYQDLFKLYIEDPDPSVRAICVSAVGRTGSPEDVFLILPYIDDDEPLVRWSVARALQMLHNPDAVDPLIVALRDDEDVNTRIAAANALGQYQLPKVIQALISGMEDEDFGVVRQSMKSLNTLTGEDFGDNNIAWIDWVAEKAPTEMFANSTIYLYEIYIPRTWFDYIAIWEEDWLEDPQPRQPKGIRGFILLDEDERIPDTREEFGNSNLPFFN